MSCSAGTGLELIADGSVITKTLIGSVGTNLVLSVNDAVIIPKP
jgi:hypothetical protein